MLQKKLIVIFIIIQAISCKPQNDMKKYEWRPTANAPKYYPMEVIDGDFFMDDGSSIYIPTGHTLMQGWGNTGATHISGPDFKLVPTSFTVKWISNLEEKIYGGKFNLPKKKIVKYFDEGFIDRRGIERTYSEVVVGLAPGGVMVVWLLGSGKSVEIERYKAKEIQVNIKEFKPGTATGITTPEYLKEIKEIIINENPEVNPSLDSIPFGIWDTYRKKYNWMPKFRFKSSDKSILDQSLLSFFNGEYFRTIGSNLKAIQKQERAIPKKIALYWIDSKGNRYGGNINFDEEEIFNIFNIIFTEKQSEQAELVIEIDKYNSDIDTYFKTNDEIYPVQKTKTEVYLSSKQ